MKRILKAELIRHLTFILYPIEMICLFIYDFTQIILSSFAFEVNANYFLFNNTIFICILTVINVSILIGQEFDNRTINNKLFLGFTKSIFYETEIIVSILESAVLLIADTLFIIVLSKLHGYNADICNTDLIINFFITLVIISSIAVFSTICTMLIKKQTVSILLIMGITLFLMYCGYASVQNLIQPMQTELFNETHEMENNPLYVSGMRRTLYNMHLFVSPYAQASYTSYLLGELPVDKFSNSIILKGASFHFEFIIADIIECIILYFLGMHLFNRQDLK